MSPKIGLISETHDPRFLGVGLGLGINVVSARTTLNHKSSSHVDGRMGSVHKIHKKLVQNVLCQKTQCLVANYKTWTLDHWLQK